MNLIIGFVLQIQKQCKKTGADCIFNLDLLKEARYTTYFCTFCYVFYLTWQNNHRDPIRIMSGAWALQKNRPCLLETLNRQILLQHAAGLLSSELIVMDLKARVPVHSAKPVPDWPCGGSGWSRGNCPTLHRMASEGYFKRAHRSSGGDSEVTT